ncbi:HPP family protein [Lujinxingia vulgaris]|nr:HPP family protein [Lujinxingia vulgaris]
MSDSERETRRGVRVGVPAIVRGILKRLGADDVDERARSRGSQALFMLLNGGLSIGLLAAMAHLARSPLIFPSLGPTAFLLFFRPLAAASSPRHTVLGHLVGVVVGLFCLWVFGLLGVPANLSEGVGLARVGAAALSLGGTGALMVYFGVAHPPAGATTLIVSLGLMPHLWQAPVLMGAVCLMALQGLVINRLAGIPYPLWRPSKQRAEQAARLQAELDDSPPEPGA